MQTPVIGPGQYGEIRRKALRDALLEQHREALETADRNERKRLLKQIDDHVEQTWRKESGRSCNSLPTPEALREYTRITPRDALVLICLSATVIYLIALSFGLA